MQSMHVECSAGEQLSMQGHAEHGRRGVEIVRLRGWARHGVSNGHAGLRTEPGLDHGTQCGGAGMMYRARQHRRTVDSRMLANMQTEAISAGKTACS